MSSVLRNLKINIHTNKTKMNNTITASMFDSIKQALAKNENSSNAGKFLKTEIGNTYTVRLLPNIKDPSKTFFHYFTFGWMSLSSGQYINLVSPQTWGDRDPINEYRYKITKMGTAEEKEKAAKITRKENWLVNAYVINDPKSPENNGQIKLLKFGRQLHKIIMEAIDGEDSDSLGSRIFDLTSKGCDFKIKVEKQGEYPSYSTSKFTMPKGIEGISDDKIQSIYSNTTDLDRVFSVKSYDELQKILNEHFHCVSTTTETTTPAIVSQPVTSVTSNKVPTTNNVVGKNVEDADNTLSGIKTTSFDTDSDEDIQKILQELNG